LEVGSIVEDDREWVAHFLVEHWGAAMVVTRGKAHHADRLPGFLAFQDRAPIGLITYRIDGAECEIVTLDSTRKGVGVGSALIEAVKDAARRAGCTRLWLITTNDNLPALRFYQKRGFLLVAVHRDAIEESRKIKPSISAIGIDGIPIRDEIELELQL
jgi:GNAT superfamily N-acetyltransferase